MYDYEVLKNLDLFSLVTALLVVITAINMGLLCSARWQSQIVSRLANKQSQKCPIVEQRLEILRWSWLSVSSWSDCGKFNIFVNRAEEA